MGAEAIPILALLIPIVIAPTAIVFRYARRVRELDHVERMRALELGRILPKDERWWSPGRLPAAVGAFLPLGSLVVAFFASESIGFRESIWASCGAVAVTAVICGTFLIARSQSQSSADRIGSKPYFDPDELDVVGRRG